MRRVRLRALAPLLLLALHQTPSLAQEDPAEPAAMPPEFVPSEDSAPPAEEAASPLQTPEPEAAPTPPPEPAPASEVFPYPEGLRGHVEFWKNVFGVWTSRQVAFADMDHPGLVYEVLTLPDAVGGSYSKDQERLVRARREAIEERLKRLEMLVELHAPLMDEEKQLALLVTTQAGNDALKGASTRVRSQRGIRERFRRGLEISGKYDRIFREVFREAGLPEDIACLPHVESSFQPFARSSAGAVGLWQFTRGAARLFMNVNTAIDERYDPVASARGAARYLKRAHDLLGDWALAITSYNHGMEGMARAKQRYGTDFDRIVREYDGRLFGFASKNFYAEFLAAREIASSPEKFFPEGVIFDPPLALDQVILGAEATPARVAQRYSVELATLAALNPAWTRRAVQTGKKVPAGSSVWLPEGTLARVAAERAKREAAAQTAKVAVAAKRPQAPAQGAAQNLLSEVVHVVRKGETLVEIAAAYGVRLADLLVANQLTERTVIRPGQSLRVPRVR